ncbi:hypothetical protein N0V84_001921 [Fusarium piperis]|uniref:Uncharacterized protein n=1 Tax=Fusarium piperis TaxID=1435070 RepID=A0A9W8WKK8_9HYPO|nr:hypothetical protein N0V84_001921 [Fusarium piperis]
MTSGKMDEGLIPVPFERMSGSWKTIEDDPAVLRVLQDTFGNSLARLNESGCQVIPRSNLQLRVLDQDNSINRALPNSTNIITTFDNAARLMSYQMRDIDGSSVQGDTQQWAIYIRVRWPLISGPAALLLATALFFGRVVAESRGIRLDTFKSEPLEMLLYGFDAKSREYLRANHKAGQSIEGEMIQLEEAVEGPELRLKHRQ